MLNRVSIRNLRNVESIDLPLAPLTAVVGPNGTGKTTILRAIDLVLGDAWPSLRSFRIPQDFTAFDTSRAIEIVIGLDPCFVHRDTHSTDHQIVAIRLTCKPYKRSGKWGDAGDLHVDLDPLNQKGEVPNVATGQPTRGQKTAFGPLRVGTELRDYARVLFIDHRRSLAQHLPSMRGSVLGRLLAGARKEFKAEDDFRKAYEQAMDLLRTEQVKEIEATVADTAKRMLGFLGSNAAESINVGFGFSDPSNPFSSLRLQYREADITIPGEELGLGIQSAIVVGVFEAFRQIGGDFGTLIIEEPEMYLHPQAQRYFFRLLSEMADQDQCQVIYATHSPVFADVNRFGSIRLVRLDQHQRTQVSYVVPPHDSALKLARDAFKLGGKFDTARNEVLFARRALLVEGYGDRIATLSVAEKLGLDPDAEGLSIVDCGGKSGIELLARVCRALAIPFVVIHDDDIWPTEGIPNAKTLGEQDAQNERERAMNRRIRDAVGGDAQIYVMSPCLETVLGIGRNASDKPRRVAEAIDGVDAASAGEQLEPLVQAVRAAFRLGT